MKDNIVISISSVRGTRHFQFTRKRLRLLKICAYIFLLLFLIISSVIYHLNNKIEFSKVKHQQLKYYSTGLVKELKALTDLKLELEQDLDAKHDNLDSITDRLSDLENMLGLEDSSASLDSRLDSAVDAAAISSMTRYMLLTQIPSGSPVKKGRTSSPFGKRIHPVTGKKQVHRGQDFAVSIGTPVFSPADGVVEIVRASKVGSGNYLRIIHDFGFSTAYLHLDKFAVRQGQFVKKNDLIAYSGNTGVSSGPHLHYEIRFIGRALDPKPFIDWNQDTFESLFSKVKGINWDTLVNKIERRASQQLLLLAPQH
jgi:murein DD-endopeptidase MepM/ murein hydrolase activator NlpD